MRRLLYSVLIVCIVLMLSIGVYAGGGDTPAPQPSAGDANVPPTGQAGAPNTGTPPASSPSTGATPNPNPYADLLRDGTTITADSLATARSGAGGQAKDNEGDYKKVIDKLKEAHDTAVKTAPSSTDPASKKGAGEIDSQYTKYMAQKADFKTDLIARESADAHIQSLTKPPETSTPGSDAPKTSEAASSVKLTGDNLDILKKLHPKEDLPTTPPKEGEPAKGESLKIANADAITEAYLSEVNGKQVFHPSKADADAGNGFNLEENSGTNPTLTIVSGKDGTSSAKLEAGVDKEGKGATVVVGGKEISQQFNSNTPGEKKFPTEPVSLTLKTTTNEDGKVTDTIIHTEGVKQNSFNFVSEGKTILTAGALPASIYKNPDQMTNDVFIAFNENNKLTRVYGTNYRIPVQQGNKEGYIYGGFKTDSNGNLEAKKDGASFFRYHTNGKYKEIAGVDGGYVVYGKDTTGKEFSTSYLATDYFSVYFDEAGDRYARSYEGKYTGMDWNTGKALNSGKDYVMRSGGEDSNVLIIDNGKAAYEDWVGAFSLSNSENRLKNLQQSKYDTIIVKNSLHDEAVYNRFGKGTSNTKYVKDGKELVVAVDNNKYDGSPTDEITKYDLQSEHTVKIDENGNLKLDISTTGGRTTSPGPDIHYGFIRYGLSGLSEDDAPGSVSSFSQGYVVGLSLDGKIVPSINKISTNDLHTKNSDLVVGGDPFASAAITTKHEDSPVVTHNRVLFPEVNDNPAQVVDEISHLQKDGTSKYTFETNGMASDERTIASIILAESKRQGSKISTELVEYANSILSGSASPVAGSVSTPGAGDSSASDGNKLSKKDQAIARLGLTLTNSDGVYKRKNVAGTYTVDEYGEVTFTPAELTSNSGKKQVLQFDSEFWKQDGVVESYEKTPVTVAAPKPLDYQAIQRLDLFYDANTDTYARMVKGNLVTGYRVYTTGEVIFGDNPNNAQVLYPGATDWVKVSRSWFGFGDQEITAKEETPTTITPNVVKPTSSPSTDEQAALARTNAALENIVALQVGINDLVRKVQVPQKSNPSSLPSSNGVKVIKSGVIANDLVFGTKTGNIVQLPDNSYEFQTSYNGAKMSWSLTEAQVKKLTDTSPTYP